MDWLLIDETLATAISAVCFITFAFVGCMFGRI
jgi:hypothetical protein